MSKLQDFMLEHPDECVRIASEKEGLIIRPLSNLGHSMLLNPGFSINGDLEEAVRSFDERNQNRGLDLAGLINSSPEQKEFLERVLDRNFAINNKIIQGYGLFDVQMFGDMPIFRYTLGIMPEYVHHLQREREEDRVGLSEFRGIFHRGISPNSFEEAFSQIPENYSDKFGF